MCLYCNVTLTVKHICLDILDIFGDDFEFQLLTGFDVQTLLKGGGL